MAKALAAGASSRFWNIWRIVGWGLAAMLLLLPLVATQFTAGVMWTALDFLAAGIIIGGTGLAFEFLVRRGGGLAYRLGAAVMLAAGFLLVWINLAVGIIGSEEDLRNLVYFVVLLIALAGAIGAGFAARGMARAMTTAALAQGIATVFAAMAGRGEPPGLLGLVLLNGAFIALFAIAAIAFRIAARREAQRKLSA